MKATKCFVCLMVVLGAGVCAVQAQDRIKMCGRELIRLAVSYCGDSRLRRSLPDAELGQQEHTGPWGQDATHEEHQTTAASHSHLRSEGKGDGFSLASHWLPASFRIRRTAGKLSDVCCEKGCSMKELIQFC